MAFPVVHSNMDEKNEDAGKIVQNIGSCNQYSADSVTQMPKKPLVFTTRLDDMKVFQVTIKYLDPIKLTETIIRESKPKFMLDVSKRPVPNKDKLMSYIQLKYKIKDFNAMQEFKSKYTCLSKNNPHQQIDAAPTLSYDDNLLLEVYEKKKQKKRKKSAYVMINDNDTCTTGGYYIRDNGTDEEYSVRNEIIRNNSNKLLAVEHQEKVKLRDTDSDSSEQLMNLNKEANDGVRNMLLQPFPSSRTPRNVIKNALKYNPCLPPKKFDKAKTTSNDNYLKCARIQMKDAITTSGSEVYVIGPNGEIQEHFKSNYVYSDNNSNDNLKITETVCCWFKRNSFIQMLQKRNISPNALKFIKTPHRCPNGECECCCQHVVKAVNRDITFNNVILPECPILTSDFVNKVPCLEITFAKPLPRNKNNIFDIEKNMDNSETTNQNHTVSNLPSAGDSNALSPTRVSTTPNIKFNNFNITTNTVGNVENTMDDKLYSSQEILVTRILKKFRDIRLHINADRKIVAELNTPINSFSSVDLRVLRTILTFAQKQVHSLGLIRGTKLSFGLNPLEPVDTNPSAVSSTVTSNVTNSGAIKNKKTVMSKANNYFDPTYLTVGEPTVKPTRLSDPNHNVYKPFVTLARQKRLHYLKAFKHFVTSDLKNINIVIPHKDDMISLPADVSMTSTPTTVKKITKTTSAKKRTNLGGIIDTSQTANKRVKIASTIDKSAKQHRRRSLTTMSPYGATEHRYANSQSR